MRNVFFDTFLKDEKRFFSFLTCDDEFNVINKDCFELDKDETSFKRIKEILYKENQVLFCFDSGRKVFEINTWLSAKSKEPLILVCFDLKYYLIKLIGRKRYDERRIIGDYFRGLGINNGSLLSKEYLLFCALKKSLSLSFEDLCFEPFLDCWVHSDEVEQFFKTEVLEEIDTVNWIQNLSNNQVKNIFCFDIECANNFDDVGKICEFGFAECDLVQKNVKKNILYINPESEFALKGVDHGKDLLISKPYDFYKTQENLCFYYNNINSLLLRDNCLLIGFAILNDIGFLQTTCNRYKLTSFSFTCFDIQTYFQKLYPDAFDKTPSLDRCFNYLYPNYSENIFFHSSEDDAKATLLIALKLFEGKDLFKEIRANTDCILHSKYYFENKHKDKYLCSMDADLHDEYKATNFFINLNEIEYSSNAKYFISPSSLAVITYRLFNNLNHFHINNIEEADFIVVLNKKEKDNFIKLFDDIDQSKIIYAKDFIGEVS